MFGVELLEHVCFELAVQSHRLDNLFTFLMRCRFDEVGDLCRAKACKLAVGDPHPGARDMRHERLDALPVDYGARATPMSKGTWEEPPQQPSTRRVHPDYTELGVDARELDLVRADKAGADEVDHVTSRDVADEEELTWPSLETTEIDRLSLELCTTVPQLEDLRDRNEVLSTCYSGHQSSDGWVRSGVRADDQIVDSPNLLAMPVKQWATNERREMDKFRGHLEGTRPSMPRWFRHIRSVVELSLAVARTPIMISRSGGRSRCMPVPSRRRRRRRDWALDPRAPEDPSHRFGAQDTVSVCATDPLDPLECRFRRTASAP